MVPADRGREVCRLHVLTDLRTRGVADILFVCVDGLTGFPEAIEAIFRTRPSRPAWYMVRSSMRFVSYEDRKPLAADLRRIYTAVARPRQTAPAFAKNGTTATR